jgi:hypothetical protein
LDRPPDILDGVIPRRTDLIDGLASILGEDEELSGSEEVRRVLAPPPGGLRAVALLLADSVDDLHDEPGGTILLAACQDPSRLLAHLRVVSYRVERQDASDPGRAGGSRRRSEDAEAERDASDLLLSA